MSINIFSIVIFIIILFIIIKNKELKMILFNMTILTASIELYLELGYFLKINDILIGYRTIVEIFLYIISIICLIKYHKTKINKNAFFLFTIVIIGIINLVLIPVNIRTANGNVSWDDFILGETFEYVNFNFFVIQEAVQMIIFIINVLAIYNSFQKEDYKKIIVKFSKITKIILIIGLIELIIKYIFHLNVYNEFCNIIFGQAYATVLTIAGRGSGYILQGLTTEASHYSYVLMISIIILFAVNTITNKEKKWIILAILLMCASMSFSSVLFISGLILIYILYWLYNSKIPKMKLIKIFLLFIIVLFTIILLIYNFNNIFNNLSESNFLERRIKSLIQEIQLIINGQWRYSKQSLEWSNRVRLVSSYETLKLIKYRPLFGLGIASVASHGSTTMLLAGIGLVGTYFWIKYVFYSLKANLSNVNRKYYKLAIAIWLLINMLNSMGLRVFYELSSIILMEAFTIIFSNSIKNMKIGRKEL